MTALFIGSVKRTGALMAWVIGLAIAHLLVFALAVCLRAEDRSDQHRGLLCTINLVTPTELREELKDGTINRDDFPAALFTAIAVGAPSGVESLLAVGVDLKVRDERGRTPLQAATQEKRAEIVRLLRAAGARR